MDILKMFKLDNKKAIITGGAQGLGKAFAIALAQAGSDVAIADIKVDKAKSVSQEIKSFGRKSIAIYADVSSKSGAEKMINEVVSLWGRLDIAINNAGESHLINAISLKETDWDKIFNLDLKGTFFCAQAEARAMIPQKYGKIINIASIAAHKIYVCSESKIDPKFQAAYSIAKAGVVHLTRCLAVEWIRYGIRVNCISPGFINTPVLEEERFIKIKPIWKKNIPIGKFGNVEDLQGAIVFLSSGVSDYMVGSELIIDGGFSVI